MKKQYRFLALLISCTLAGAAPMSALCSEASSIGETTAEEEASIEGETTVSAEASTAGESEVAAETETGTEDGEEETSETAEGSDPAIEETDGGAGTKEAGTDGITYPEEELADSEEADAAGTTEFSQPEEEAASLITEGYCGEKLTWEYRDGSLYIEGTGEMNDYDKENQPEWIGYAGLIDELHIGKGITLIDGDAFEELNELRTIYFEGNEK